ncbi:MAG: hypothetical protein UR73_C0038G0017 [candidate division WS6 bacterium GW2011_GWF1_35_23]|uniref:Uncharacterized protein n=1 Tax=candidate division WS6 bacterium GW2011_GWF1_35_23 TaxID=1619097 RepID=A0A0G0BZ01_9BACT|nr:MAG: hypothetical protein UR73_C0038G0017 [candidate division WS6 bacterium GW2011_GWF1_35_23]KKQ29801.1 MAG: hypothetical protein US46_C0017G0017 [Candidatus Shapirobacteria bacterium GW2011_GWF2_37_20]
MKKFVIDIHEMGTHPEGDEILDIESELNKIELSKAIKNISSQPEPQVMQKIAGLTADKIKLLAAQYYLESKPDWIDKNSEGDTKFGWRQGFRYAIKYLTESNFSA